MLEKIDWRQSFKGAFRSSSDVFTFLETKSEFPDKTYPVFIPQRLATRIKDLGKDSSLWKQFIPSQDELVESSLEGLYDPIGDSTHSQGSGIIHRYKNRILFAPTTVCPVNCRYCFRKNELAQKDDILKGKFEELKDYLEKHPEVEEVILTGGDPLIVSNSKLKELFELLAGKVKYLRLHTRTPMILPERIDQEFLGLLEWACESFEVVSIAVHANHADEFDEYVQYAIKSLRRTGVQLLSQSVLLKGVNDSVQALKELYQTYARLGVRSYYLHHPDRVKGAMNFYIPLEDGRKIYMKLREELSGWAIPHYVIDPENGQGKTLAYNPEAIKFGGSLIDRFGQVHEISR